MAANPPHKPGNPRVTIHTSEGSFTAELFPEDAPNTVENFLKYVKEHFYEGLIFHRVISGFVIQGGGIQTNGKQRKPTHPPIKLEISKKLRHWDGALSMARTMDPHSATSQFYVCHGPQHALDDNYAVFGIVTDGMDVVDKIARMPTDRSDQPKKTVTIDKVELKE